LLSGFCLNLATIDLSEIILCLVPFGHDQHQMTNKNKHQKYKSTLQNTTDINNIPLSTAKSMPSAEFLFKIFRRHRRKRL